MAIVSTRIVSIDFEDGAFAAQQATLVVEHPNGDLQYLVVPVLRTSEQMPKRCGTATMRKGRTYPCTLNLSHEGPHKWAKEPIDG